MIYDNARVGFGKQPLHTRVRDVSPDTPERRLRRQRSEKDEEVGLRLTAGQPARRGIEDGRAARRDPAVRAEDAGARRTPAVTEAAEERRDGPTEARRAGRRGLSVSAWASRPIQDTRASPATRSPRASMGRQEAGAQIGPRTSPTRVSPVHTDATTPSTVRPEVLGRGPPRDAGTEVPAVVPGRVELVLSRPPPATENGRWK